MKCCEASPPETTTQTLLNLKRQSLLPARSHKGSLHKSHSPKPYSLCFLYIKTISWPSHQVTRSRRTESERRKWIDSWTHWNYGLGLWWIRHLFSFWQMLGLICRILRLGWFLSYRVRSGAYYTYFLGLLTTNTKCVFSKCFQQQISKIRSSSHMFWTVGPWLSSWSRWVPGKDAKMLAEPTPGTWVLSFQNGNFLDNSNKDGSEDGVKNQSC